MLPLTRGGPAGVPSWWPARFYYGWALVGALGLTATLSYGILSYAFGVFIAPMGRELGWSKAAVTGAFSLASVVAGVAAVPVGRWVDRHGPRGIMTAGAVLAALLLVWWSRVRSLPEWYVLWALMGLASAAVLYEPAFAVIAAWFQRRRGRALTALTFVGGFASVIFVPLATWLVAAAGWRAALLWLAALYAGLAIPVHGLVLRRHPRDLGLEPDGLAGQAQAEGRPGAGRTEHSVAAGDAMRSPGFRWMVAAFALSSLATTAVTVHLVPLLLERGHGAAFAGVAMGTLGLMALPGRLVFTPLGDRWSRAGVTASIFALQAAGCLVLAASHRSEGVWAFVVLFGAGFGAITPARAALVAELYGSAHYGRIAGVVATAVALARAVAPIGASLLYSVGGGEYDLVVAVLLALCLASAAAVLAAGRGQSGELAQIPVEELGDLRDHLVLGGTDGLRRGVETVVGMPHRHQ
ncbi:MAG TPA: MFS transporter [Gemmatimonadales bacterium]|nr:MFS transporter [Gemmatimonadales bacterium]